MRNLRLEIEYDGTGYCGWQAQRRHESEKTSQRKKSIQETIEKVLQKVIREKTRLIASGRTDAGVHALAQVANFHTKSNISIDKLQGAFNGLLPDDIAVVNIKEACTSFHSRFDAKSKIYRYTILNRKYPSAALRNTIYFYPYPLDVKLMFREAKVLLGRHDFKSFQASDKRERASIKTIKKINVSRDKDCIYIDIESDGFLYNMVRNISGTLIEIGRGKFPPGSLRKILREKDRRLAGPTLPAAGLSLIKVRY